MKFKNSVFVLLHIPKTGGSTINNHLQNEFGKLSKDSGELVLKTDEEVSFIFGHNAYYGIHKNVAPKEPKYISFIRNPARRMVSGYNWDISISKLDTLEYPFEEYVKWKNNYMTKYLSRYMYSGRYRRLERNAYYNTWKRRIERLQKVFGVWGYFNQSSRFQLTRAKKTLERCFFVGITETLDDDFTALLDMLRMERSFEAVNVTGDKTVKANNSNGFIPSKIIEWTPEREEYIKKYNAHDYELYEYALKLSKLKKAEIAQLAKV
jgi:hypothetical protein